MFNKNKSAKDVAFDRERVQYKREISKLKQLLIAVGESEYKRRNDDLTGLVVAMEKERAELLGLIDTLFEYADIPKEALELMIVTEKSFCDSMKKMSDLFRAFNNPHLMSNHKSLLMPRHVGRRQIKEQIGRLCGVFDVSQSTDNTHTIIKDEDRGWCMTFVDESNNSFDVVQDRVGIQKSISEELNRPRKTKKEIT